MYSRTKVGWCGVTDLFKLHFSFAGLLLQPVRGAGVGDAVINLSVRQPKQRQITRAGSRLERTLMMEAACSISVLVGTQGRWGGV